MVAQNVILKNEHPAFEMNLSIESKIDKLDQHLLDLLQYLKGFTNDQLNGKPAPEAWSALQVCHHLLKTEELSLAYIKKKLSFEPKLKVANMATKMRLKLLKTYLNTPMKYKAPNNVSTEVLPAYSTLPELESKWLALRADLKSYLKNLPADLFDKEVYKHPFAGRLSLEGMIYFFEEHFLRHLKQIKKTLVRVG